MMKAVAVSVVLHSRTVQTNGSSVVGSGLLNTGKPAYEPSPEMLFACVKTESDRTCITSPALPSLGTGGCFTALVHVCTTC